jgi:hypothetical protein
MVFLSFFLVASQPLTYSHDGRYRHRNFTNWDFEVSCTRLTPVRFLYRPQGILLILPSQMCMACRGST